jgi:cytoskeleton protein RodZ
MEDHDTSPTTPAPPRHVGEELRAAREAQGLSRGDIAAQTRVAERHLISIEENRFSELAAPTYALGFARAYAKAVGLDENEIAARVRRELDAQPQHAPKPLPSFEPGDPARVPPTRIAWAAGLLAVVVVGLLIVYWSNFLSPEGELPDLASDVPQRQQAGAAAAPRPAASQPAPNGPVMLTATAPQVWVKVTDAGGNQLFQKEMGQGESYVVPADAQGPQLRTARPDLLQVTVGGRPVARLGDKPEVISGVALTPAALLARGAAPETPRPTAPVQAAPVSTTAQ